MRLASVLCAALAALACLAAPAAAETVRRTYPATTADFRNPERGFWSFAADDFASVTAGDLADLSAKGLTMGYGIVRLDDYRAKPLPKAFLAKLGRAFALARAARVKIILRFAYNYPANEHQYQNAKDAALDVVLKHIAQLKPSLAKNADVIAVLQAGFIGAWGEGHTSSNKLTTKKNKATIRDALLAALPEGRMLQWRYPGDVVDWRPEPPPGGRLATIGLHNDCFLSSTTDVGTYPEDEAKRDAQRDYAAKLSRATLYGGETCNVGSGTERMTCADILAEGRRFHLTTLNGEYSPAFIKAWKAGGCYDEVRRSMGYRLMLRSAEAGDAVTRGATVQATLRLTNEGWARLYNPRPFRLVATHRETGRRFVVETAGDIRLVEPERRSSRAFDFGWTVPADAPTGVYDLAAALPDGSATLAEEPAYAVRFANGSGADFGWDAETGVYRLGLTVTVSE